jgi:hypothetical protein
MVYGNMSMMIFILATGYLFAVYLLLALAKRTGKHNVTTKSGTVMIQEQHQEETGLASNVTEVVNSQ